MQSLLKEFNLNGIKLKNRIVMAPLTRSRADNKEKVPTDLHVEYYRQRSSAGLIISEGSQVSPKAVGYVNTPGIYSEVQADAWRKVTDAVHEEGGRIFIQLWHVGRISHPDFHNGELPHAPSAINPNILIRTYDGKKETHSPKEMTQEDISETIAAFKKAAQNSLEAGFDGIEIHSSNGYLFHQFFNKCSNIRTDKYGGSIENRARFLFEVLDEVKSAVPEQKIGLRLNPSAHGFAGITIDEETIPTFEYIVNKLNEYDLAYLHLSEPFTDVSEIPYAVANIAEHFRPIYNGNLMINNEFDAESGNKVIEEGLADLVAFGKLFISNPDLPKRIELNSELNDWNSKTFYTPGSEGYTDYPKLKI